MSSTTCKASENVYEKDELTSQKLSLLQWVVHKNCFSGATERTAMIVPWHDERTRTGAFVILPADELLSASANINRQEAQEVRVAHDNGFRCPVTNPDNNYG